MNKNEIKEFTTAFLPAYEIYGKELSDGAVRVMFSLLESYDILDIKKALSAHMKESVFAPKPADIILQIEKVNHDGRLESDEAWAVALKAMNEYASVELNDEIAEAKNSSDYIYNDGDKVGARMAFKAAYERIVSEHRENNIPVRWFRSFGFDVEGREVLNMELDARDRIAYQGPKQVTYNPDGTKVISELVKKLADANSI